LVGIWHSDYRGYDANHDGVISNDERSTPADTSEEFTRDGKLHVSPEDLYSPSAGVYFHRGSTLYFGSMDPSNAFTIITLSDKLLVINRLADDAGGKTLVEFGYSR